MRGGNGRAISRSYFNKTWRKARPLVKLSRFGDFMKCSDCTEMNEKLHGAPGVRPIQDTQQRAEVERRAAIHHDVSMARRKIGADEPAKLQPGTLYDIYSMSLCRWKTMSNCLTFGQLHMRLSVLVNAVTISKHASTTYIISAINGTTGWGPKPSLYVASVVLLPDE